MNIYRLKLLLLLPLVLVICLSAYAQDNDYVLVLNSINLEEAWVNHFDRELKKRFSSENELELKSYFLSVPILKNEEEVRKVRENILQTHPIPPKAVIIIGDPGWLVSAALFDGPWKNIPIVLCYSRDRVPRNIQTLLTKTPLTATNSIPIAEFNKRYNITVLRQPYFIPQTLQLIKHLQPEVRRVALISDYRYISMVTRESVRQTIKTNFPELTFESLSSDSLSTEQLLDTLSTYGRETGVIYYSWFRQYPGKNNYYLSDHLKKILPTFLATPVFTLADLDLHQNLYAGGHYISVQDFTTTVMSILHRILDGETAASIPYQDGGTPRTYLNYADLQWCKVPETLYPADAVYYYKPPTFYQQYATYIWMTCIFCILLLSVYLYYSFRSRKQSLLKEKDRFFLENILDNLPIPTIVKDVNDDGRYLIWNKKAEEISGIPASLLLNRRKSEVPDYGESSDMQNIEEEIIRTGQARSFIKQVTNSQGKTCTLLLYKALVSYRDGQRWLISTALDVTEEEENKKELIRAKERAEEADRLKSAFLANMSHEIRTPLNAIVGFSSILAETADSAENREYIQIIEDNNHLLLQLINDILDLSRIEAGLLEFTYSDVEINHCLNDLEDAFRFRMPKNVECIVAPSLDRLIVNIDKNRVMQILGNYISNAIKYTTRGSITIGYYPPREGKLKLFVRDTGCGIAPDKYQQVFERFVKLNSFKQGTGLGLSICHMLAEKMNATVGLTSEIDKDSEFWLEIPYLNKKDTGKE